MVHTHEAGGICLVCSDLGIDQDVPLHEDGDDVSVGERVLEFVPQDENQGKTFSSFVWSR